MNNHCAIITIVNVATLIVWFIVVLIFHPKPLANGTGSSIQQPAHDFLSAAKPLDGYSSATAPMALMTQQSHASSDYLHCTESLITVPVQYTENDNNANMTYNNNSVSQRGQLQNSANTDGDQPLSPSSTRSTVTFVSHRNSGCRKSDSNTKELDLSCPPPHLSIDLSNEHVQQEETDWNTSQITAMTNDSKSNSNNRCPNSNDSTWLQQSPRGGNR